MMYFCELHHRRLQTERWKKKSCFTFSKWLIYKTIRFHSFSVWWRFLFKCSVWFFVVIFFRFGILSLLLWCIVYIFHRVISCSCCCCDFIFSFFLLVFIVTDTQTTHSILMQINIICNGARWSELQSSYCVWLCNRLIQYLMNKY